MIQFSRENGFLQGVNLYHRSFLFPDPSSGFTEYDSQRRTTGHVIIKALNPVAHVLSRLTDDRSACKSRREKTVPSYTPDETVGESGTR